MNVEQCQVAAHSETKSSTAAAAVVRCGGSGSNVCCQTVKVWSARCWSWIRGSVWPLRRSRSIRGCRMRMLPSDRIHWRRTQLSQRRTDNRTTNTSCVWCTALTLMRPRLSKFVSSLDYHFTHIVIGCQYQHSWLPEKTLKLGFHYPSSRAELSARELGCIFWHPNWRAFNSGAFFNTRQLGPWTLVVETGRPCN